MNPFRTALTLAIVLGLFLQSCSVTLPVAGHFADKAVAKRNAPAPKHHTWLITGFVTGIAIDATLVFLFLQALGNEMGDLPSMDPNCQEEPHNPNC
jgi:hypothetical protein